MKLECSILGISLASNQRPGKPSKGIVVLGKANVKGSSNAQFQIKVSTVKERNQAAIEVSKSNIGALITSHAQVGKITIDFINPKIRIFISDANPKRLGLFIGFINKIRNGEDPGNLDGVKEVKSTELQMVTKINITHKKTYRLDFARGFPTTLRELSITFCEMTQLDVRWFANVQLVSLNLSNNSLGKGDLKKLRLIQKLSNLQTLDLSNNFITYIPNNVTFPSSLVNLELHSNPLESIPVAVKNSRNLRALNISKTSIRQLPKQNYWPRLVQLNISETHIYSLPAYFDRARVGRLLCSRRTQTQYNGHRNTKSGIPSLEMFAAAAVKNDRRLDVKILPWTIILTNLAEQCSKCLKWKASDLIIDKYESRNIREFAIESDILGDILLHCPVCKNHCI